MSPRQLRHVLSAQAINRAMTLVYARTAGRTVADEYFSVSEKVEALYGRPKTLTADGGAQMAELRREMRRRMVGNGYCARPVELGCHVESIGESCTYFATTVESRPSPNATPKPGSGGSTGSSPAWRTRPADLCRGGRSPQAGSLRVSSSERTAAVS